MDRMKQTYKLNYSDSPSLFMAEHMGWESVSAEARYCIDGLTREYESESALFQYTLSGSGLLEIDGKTKRLKSGDSFLVRIPGEYRYYRDPNQADSWEFIWIHLRGWSSNDIMLYMQHTNGSVFKLDPDSTPIRMLWKLYEDLQDGRLNDKYYTSLRVQEWIYGLMNYFERDEVQQKTLSMEAALNFMQQRFGEPLTLEQIADAAGMKRNYFCRVFHELQGEPPMQYLTRIRMEHASKVLLYTSVPILDVALQCGFDNSSYFGKVFKAWMGKSPSQFREGRHQPRLNSL